VDPVEHFFTALGELFLGSDGKLAETLSKSYAIHGFDSKKPPSDAELAKWAAKLLEKYHAQLPDAVNLPLVGLMFIFNEVVGKKLDNFDMMHLKALSAVVYNMGNRMARLNIGNPFDDGSKN